MLATVFPKEKCTESEGVKGVDDIFALIHLSEPMKTPN
jgi:hypothetical protein